MGRNIYAKNFPLSRSFQADNLQKFLNDEKRRSLSPVNKYFLRGKNEFKQLYITKPNTHKPKPLSQSTILQRKEVPLNYQSFNYLDYK